MPTDLITLAERCNPEKVLKVTGAYAPYMAASRVYDDGATRMTSFELVTPPTHLPITAVDADLAAAVVEEVERTVLWRAIVHQTRKILIDGPLHLIELEPTTAITSITRWTSTDPADVVADDTYNVVSRDPAWDDHRVLESGSAWPEHERDIGFIRDYIR